MGPRRKHRLRLEVLESRLLLSARGDGADGHQRNVDFDNDGPSEMAAQDHAAHDAGAVNANRREKTSASPKEDSLTGIKSIAGALERIHGGRKRDMDVPSSNGHDNDHSKGKTEPPGKALGHEKQLSRDPAYGGDWRPSAGEAHGSRPVSPYTDTQGAVSRDEADRPALGYQPNRQRDAEPMDEDESRAISVEIEARLSSIVLLGPGSPSPKKTLDVSTPRGRPIASNAGSVSAVEHGDQVSQAQPSVVASLPRHASLEVIAPDSIEPSAAPEESDARAERRNTESASEEPANQPEAAAGDTVTASPLGAAGMPVERMPNEVRGVGELPSEPAGDVGQIDVSSAAVKAFWAAVDALPVVSIAAPAFGAGEGLAEAVSANFDSLTAAVDTLLDTLAAQFDLSGPGRMRDLVFASSAALLAALACEKVRRRQQRLEDENLASLGFDADGYLSLAEGL